MRRALLDRILAERAARRAFVVATRLADGEQRLVMDDDDATADPIVVPARAAMVKDLAETIELADGAWLLAPESPPVRLVVIGAVHTTQLLVPMARLLDLEVTIIDPRRAFGTLERFPDVTLIDDWPEPALARLGLDRRTAVVALTHDRKIDEPALALALRSPAFYIGALGSRKTQEARRARMRETFTDVELARIHGPIGLPIGARSPAEVALAILAELVAALRRP
ncbi:MAG: XdhC family protein [Deltaproteobacteria bacterium]|nr:XdhC family protein [Deltaproteobacteria bacterium]